MKKLLVLLAFATSGVSAQTMYKMESLPIYDEDGNVYQMREVFDHLPTRQDSIQFKKSLSNYYVEIDRARKTKLGIKQYQTAVAEARLDKNGVTVIRPVTKFRSTWYRYHDAEVKAGDTVLISREDAFEPNF